MLVFCVVLGEARAADLLINTSQMETFGAIQKQASALERKIEDPGADLDSLIKDLDSIEWSKRAVAVAKIGGMGVKARKAIPALVLLMGDKHPSVRNLVTKNLPRLGEPSHEEVEALAVLLDYGDKRVEEGAAAALKTFGEEGRIIVEGALAAREDARRWAEKVAEAERRRQAQDQRQTEADRLQAEADREVRRKKVEELDNRVWTCSGKCWYDYTYHNKYVHDKDPKKDMMVTKRDFSTLSASAPGPTSYAAKEKLRDACTQYMDWNIKYSNQSLDEGSVTCPQ